MTSQPQSQRKGNPHFEYRSSVFETSTLGDRGRALFRHSPYFMIAVAVNLTLIAIATVWKLNEAKKDAAPEIYRALLSAAQEDPKKADELKSIDIFDQKDERIDEPEFEVPTDAPELIPVDDRFKMSDRNETDNNNDDHTALGSDEKSTLIGTHGFSDFTTIGVGGGSVRGDRSGWGNGRGGRENLFAKPRRTMHSRDSRTEAAVEAGLRWLARHQNADGSWSPDGFTAKCQGGTVCAHGKDFGDALYRGGATGLALLAFLGAGHDHHSQRTIVDPFSNTKIRVGDVILRGLLWLKDQQDESGSIGEPSRYKWGYNHAIGALALCEAYGLSRAIQLRQPAQRAIDCLIGGQNPAPGGTGLWGWRYTPRCGDNDLSVTGWAVMALKSAELAGLTIAQDSLQGAYNYCAEVSDRTTGHAGYLTRADAGSSVKSNKNGDYLGHPAMAAVGMCIRSFVKHDVTDPMLEAGAKLLARDLPVWNKQKKSNDFYYWYYGSLALNQYDGPESPRPGKGQYWKDWEGALRKALLENQANDPRLCSDGSWDGDDRWGVDGGGRVYATAINTLTFEVYYRYANAFGTVKKAKK